MKRKLSICLGLGLLLITLTACKGEVPAKRDKAEQAPKLEDFSPTYGGEVSLALTRFETLNPLMTENKYYYYFSKLIYESMLDFDENFQVKESLAESYRLMEDGRNVEVKLRDDVYWHDGEKLTSEDVKFTINTIKYANGRDAYSHIFQGPLGSYSPGDIRRIMDVETVDDLNLIIKFDRSYSNILEVLTFPIIPSHVFQGKSPNESYESALSIENYPVIGTGPYKFDTYENMKELRLLANPEYREGGPYIEKIKGLVLESEEDISQAFDSRQIDISTSMDVDWDKYSQKSGLRIIDYPSSNYEFLGFNFNNPLMEGDLGREIRKAICYGINKEAIVNRIYLGNASPVDLPVHPDSWLYFEEGQAYSYNQSKAREILKEAGFKEKDKIMENDKGEKLSFSLVTNTYNPLREKTAELIVEDLSKIGIELVLEKNKALKNPTREEIRKDWEETMEKITAGNFDIGLLGWDMGIIPDLSFAFHSSQIKYGTNFINYSNEEIDNSIEKAFLSKDINEKKSNYNELQGLILEDLPYISLFFKNKATLVDGKILGDLNPSFINPYKGIDKAYIKNDPK